MVWEARTKRLGDWIESQVFVARATNKSSRRWDSVMMQSDEWQDFIRRFELLQGDDGVWRSGES